MPVRGCAGWLSASEANGTHRCGSCELVPPVVSQAGQWPATRKPGDRDRDALILLPLDARQTQTAGRGGATADGVAFDAIEFVARVSWRRSGMGCCRRMLPGSLRSHRFRRRPGAGPRHASRCRCPGPVAQAEPGEGAGLANDRVVASGEVLQADDLAVFEDCEVQVPSSAGQFPRRGQCCCTTGRPLRRRQTAPGHGEGVWPGSWILSAARPASWPGSWPEGCRNSRCGVFRRNPAIGQ